MAPTLGPIVKVSGWGAFTDEAFVDGGHGTPAQQKAAADRIKARWVASHAAWLARPVWDRAWIRVRYHRRWYEARRRLDHAARAIRGIECERD